jgi:hypothetical protein
MQYFNFERLINKYSTEFTLVTPAQQTTNNMGDYVKGEAVKTTMTGAIISIKESKIYRSEGTLTSKDKQLFTLTPIKEPLEGLKVIYKECVYNVEDTTENAEFTGCYAYTLKFVSAFNEGGGEND